MKYAYIRVSTQTQNEERQRVCLEKYDIDRWFCDKASGANMDRPELRKLLDLAVMGDEIYICDFSRLARNTYDLLLMTDEFTRRGIRLVSDKENVDIVSPIGKFMMTVMGAVYEFERELMKENQAEGIQVAKEKGVFKGGRNKKRIDRDVYNENMKRYKNNEITKSQFAVNVGVSRPTLDKIIKEREKKRND